MSVLVPTLPSEVLDFETPVSGDPEEAYSAGARLNEVAEQLQQLVGAVGAARAQIVANKGLAIERAEQALSERVQHRAQTVHVASAEGSAAFRLYGQEIERIHVRARRLEAQVSEQLAEIRGCASEVQEILVAVGCSMRLQWNIGVPLEMPRSEVGYDGMLDHVGLRDRYESQWCVAALRWRGALDELRLLQGQWRSLLDDRVGVERFFVNTLERVSDGEALLLTDAAGASVTAAAAISATGKVATSFGGATDPGERRSHALLAGLYSDYALQLAVTGKPPPAEAVALWWSRLNAIQRQQLIAEAPLALGNLAGVPLESRVAANAVSAEHFANAKGISAQEANYWSRVAAGRVRLVVSDPSKSRIVEMLGEPGLQTTSVVTFLPGTVSQMKHFYSGEAQQVSQYLVTRSGGSTVAFVYKDGSWSSWLGPGANTNYVRLQELGGQVADFQSEVIDREPSLKNASQVAVAHSAGMSVLSGAEIAGAQFDTVVSLGGAFALREWRPDPSTEYHHFQYDNDAINMIDGGRLWTPHELKDVFAQHVFASEGHARFESHSRIAEGPETNKQALDVMFDVVNEVRK